jgi:hypothetical protein
MDLGGESEQLHFRHLVSTHSLLASVDQLPLEPHYQASRFSTVFVFVTFSWPQSPGASLFVTLLWPRSWPYLYL